ncbi:MAG: HAD hydrolase family protein [Roseiarcus sp.]
MLYARLCRFNARFGRTRFSVALTSTATSGKRLPEPEPRRRAQANERRAGAFRRRAFGDNENDPAILVAAFHGVAMGGAPAQGKEAARKIIGDDNSDPIAEAIGIWLGERAGDESPVFEL